MPVDGCLAGALEKIIGAGEGAAAEETAACGERARVRRLDDVVCRVRDHRLLAARRRAPENKDHRLLARIEQADDLVRKDFPSLPAMRVRLMLAHREDRVEEQHALVRPRLQAAIVRDPAAEIVVQLLEDVLQARRCRHTGLHGERKAMCLSWAMIRILPEDDDLRIFIARVMQGIEDIIHPRIDALRAVLVDEELTQLAVVRLLQFAGQAVSPIIMENFHEIPSFPISDSSDYIPLAGKMQNRRFHGILRAHISFRKEVLRS